VGRVMHAGRRADADLAGRDTDLILAALEYGMTGETRVAATRSDRADDDVLRNTLGTRMERHAATRRLKHLAETAGIRMPRMHPHRPTKLSSRSTAPKHLTSLPSPACHTAVTGGAHDSSCAPTRNASMTKTDASSACYADTAIGSGAPGNSRNNCATSTAPSTRTMPVAT
jgi:hypothetical protein